MIKIISIMAEMRKLIVWFLRNYEVKDVMNLKVAIA